MAKVIQTIEADDFWTKSFLVHFIKWKFSIFLSRNPIQSIFSNSFTILHRRTRTSKTPEPFTLKGIPFLSQITYCHHLSSSFFLFMHFAIFNLLHQYHLRPIPFSAFFIYLYCSVALLLYCSLLLCFLSR